MHNGESVFARSFTVHHKALGCLSRLYVKSSAGSVNACLLCILLMAMYGATSTVVVGINDVIVTTRCHAATFSGRAQMAACAKLSYKLHPVTTVLWGWPQQSRIYTDVSGVAPKFEIDTSKCGFALIIGVKAGKLELTSVSRDSPA